jgi:hypothetical protein
MLSLQVVGNSEIDDVDSADHAKGRGHHRTSKKGRARVPSGDNAAMTAPKAIAVRIGAALWSIWLAGCGISQPQTAAEFRNGVANGIASGAAKETFEVDRPLAQVGVSFQRLASECLSKTIRMTEHQPGVSFVVVTDSYKPTVRVSPSEAELQLQVRERGNIIHVTREPEGGSYLLVADARPASAAKTRIDLYRFPIGHAQLAQAVRDWSSGTSVTCPSSFRN